ncbi:MAG: hypothetical protein PHX30_06195 [Candidatus Pacebacteria bacterium]|nr:hypothetical protein [Candidatus Paceibacterota bacterium]
MKTLVILTCGEGRISDAVEELAQRYEKQLPGVKIILFFTCGSSVPILDSPCSLDALTIMERIRLFALGEPFALAIVNHEGCSYNDIGVDRETKEFQQIIDTRSKLPKIFLDSIGNLLWVSFYNIEMENAIPGQNKTGMISIKARFLGRYF